MEDKAQVVIVVGGALALSQIQAIKSQIPGAVFVHASKVEDLGEPTIEVTPPVWIFDESDIIKPDYSYMAELSFDSHSVWGTIEKFAKVLEPLEYERDILQIPTKTEISNRLKQVDRFFGKPDRIPVPATYKRNRFAR